MRIKKDSIQPIEEGAKRFLLVADAMDGDILLEKAGKPLLTLSVTEEGALTVEAFYGESERLTLKAEGAYRREVILTQGFARLALYVEGVLVDEDFFLQEMDFSASLIHTKTYMHFEAGYEYHSALESTAIPSVISSLDGFRPIGREMGITSVRPAILADRLHLFYTDTRRNGQVKSGRGAFRAQALYSEDGVSFGTAPVAVAVDEIAEYGVLDATCLWCEGRGYLYYLTKREEGLFVRVSVSEDGFSFMKTGLDASVPSWNTEAITALQVLETEKGIYLLYAEGGRLFAAKSQDLLHFSSPTLLLKDEAIFDFHFFEEKGVLYLLYQTEKGLFLATWQGDFAEGAAIEPIKQSLDIEKAKAISFKDTLYLFGVKNGAAVAKRASLQEGTLLLL